MGVQYKTETTMFHSIEDNLDKLKLKYPVNSEGYFGNPGHGRSHTRNIESENPLETAKDFFNNIAEGGKKEILYDRKTGKEKGIVVQMRDGTFISFREISTSDGSPVVEINIDSSNSERAKKEIQTQKIHFIKGNTQ